MTAQGLVAKVTSLIGSPTDYKTINQKQVLPVAVHLLRGRTCSPPEGQLAYGQLAEDRLKEHTK